MDALLSAAELTRALAPALPREDKSGDRSVAATEDHRLDLAATGPLLMLMLWAALLHSEGRIDARLLRHLGADGAKLEALLAEHPKEIETLRWLRLAGMLFSRESLAALFRARLSEMLMGISKASELLAITKAMERMPEWMWGEEDAWGQAPLPAHPNQQARGPAATRAGTVPGPYQDAEGQSEQEAMKLLREMLNAKYDEQSPEEIDDFLLRAQMLADRLNDFAVAPRAGYTSPTRSGARKPSATKKRARPRR